MVNEKMLEEFNAELKSVWECNPMQVSAETKKRIDDVLTENFEQGSAHSFEMFDLLVTVYNEALQLEFTPTKGVK